MPPLSLPAAQLLCATFLVVVAGGCPNAAPPERSTKADAHGAVAAAESVESKQRGSLTASAAREHVAASENATQLATAAPPETPPPSVNEERGAAPARIAPSAIAYNRPQKVPFGQRFDIELFIDITGGDAAAAALAERKAQSERVIGEPVVAHAVTGADVEVVLKGTNAKIDALIDGGRRIDAKAPARWRWAVQPDGADAVELVLQVWQLDPTTRARLDPAVAAFEDTIVVQVTRTQKLSFWLSENWEWAWTFFAGPLGALGVHAVRRRRAARAADPSAPS